jgi:hypothetical protein
MRGLRSVGWVAQSGDRLGPPRPDPHRAAASPPVYFAARPSTTKLSEINATAMTYVAARGVRFKMTLPNWHVRTSEWSVVCPHPMAPLVRDTRT